MDSTSVGDLVKVDDGGPPLDGIVFDVPSRSKVVVAVVDPSRGPMFRTVHPDTLSERSEESTVDRPLRLLIRRTPSPVGATANGRTGAGRSAGHTRAAMHRTTGR